MTETEHQFIQLTGSVVCGRPLPDGFSVSDSVALYQLAGIHDMAHLIGYACSQGQIRLPDEEIRKKFLEKHYNAIRRVAILEAEIERIRNTFEQASIDFILLKGSVIRTLYPASFMRVSGDIDILVRSKDLHRAENALQEALGFTVTSEGAHHDHVTSPSGYHVDLHFTLTEHSSPAKAILDTVWDHCALAPGKNHEYIMEDAFFYLFHMYHASVHFQFGGCGVRPVLDTWILNHRVEFAESDRRTLLEAAGLGQFSGAIESLSESWFSAAPLDEDLNALGAYILSGGVYGGKQRIAAEQAQRGNRKAYILRRIFPPRRSLKIAYPVLKHVPVLLPICWGHRLIKAFSEGKTGKAKYELEKSKQDLEKSREIMEMFQQLGLK